MYDRELILKRIMSRSLTRNEFNYETLSAPPLYSMFTPEDINQLHYIATSAKYSAKLKEKYEMINEIMAKRGFKKLISGTNRVAYEPVFANNFIVKVAYDSVAINDSKREFYNQNFLKPFCTKVFEVSPCGTIGVFERVNPITCIEEFLSVAEYIHNLINNQIVGEYVLDDIGTLSYQNYGFRYGFGPVILDFPYMYEVDPKKIYCVKPNPKDPTGYCNGPIDYDRGFNRLICKKCGAVYKSYELAKKIEYKNEFIKESEERKMKIRLSGGTFLTNKTEERVTGDFRNPVNSIKSNLLNKKIEKQIKEEEKKEAETVEEKTVNGVAPAVEEEVVEEAATEEEPVEEPKEIKKAFEFFEDEDIKGDPGYINDPANNTEEVVSYLEKINNIYNYSDTSDEDKETIVKNICSFLESIFIDNIEVSMKMIANIFRKKKNFKDEIIKEFLSANSCSVNNQLIRLLLSSGNYHPESEIVNINNEDNDTVITIATEIIKNDTGKSVASLEDIKCEVTEDFIEDFKKISGIEDRPEEPDENPSPVELGSTEEVDYFASESATGYLIVDGSIINKKDLFENADSDKVVVIKNKNGKYLTIDGSIVAIDKIDLRNIRDITIVPKEWYKDTMKILDSVKQAPVGAVAETSEISDEEGVSEEEE